jgi:hypothetical protein
MMDETKPPRPGVIPQSRRGKETSSTGEENKPPLQERRRNLRFILKKRRNIHYNG